MSKTTVANWKKQKRHDITLPSGVEVSVELPSVVQLIRGKEIPNDLVSVALGKEDPGEGSDLSDEQIQKFGKFNDFLIARTVVDPDLKEDEVTELPAEDQELLLNLALRRTNRDGTGRHIAGLEVQDDFASFRGLGLAGTPGLGL